ncbi:hypothetical protein [Schaedlerella arabinosiphila]|jgi:hypothetical protein|nr:hypothetical protein [Schaedlerella arabinosiphila]
MKNFRKENILMKKEFKKPMFKKGNMRIKISCAPCGPEGCAMFQCNF